MNKWAVKHMASKSYGEKRGSPPIQGRSTKKNEAPTNVRTALLLQRLLRIIAQVDIRSEGRDGMGARTLRVGISSPG